MLDFVSELAVVVLDKAELQPSAAMIGQCHQVPRDLAGRVTVAEIEPLFELDIETLARVREKISKAPQVAAVVAVNHSRRT
ncbi:MAG: hypothetical protein ACLP8S_12310 [Solirubrobacteraceae bacterium]